MHYTRHASLLVLLFVHMNTGRTKERKQVVISLCIYTPPTTSLCLSLRPYLGLPPCPLPFLGDDPCEDKDAAPAAV